LKEGWKGLKGARGVLGGSGRGLVWECYTRRIHRKTTDRFLQIPFRFDPNRYQNDEKRNLKEFGVLKDTIKGTSSPKNVQTIPFERIRLKKFEGIWSFFRCMLWVLVVGD
jgi:hypothetical protein